jgi:RimJ/RimL family protein N-acetyltransferase
VSCALTLLGNQIKLEPLAIHHLAELLPLLEDPALRRFIGGPDLSRTEREHQLRQQLEGPPPGSEEIWLNWVIRERHGGAPAGTAQATVRATAAHLAWVVGVDFQRRGYATEAAQLLVGLARRTHHVSVAQIHPEHLASQRVAEKAGLVQTARRCQGEEIWEDPRGVR